MTFKRLLRQESEFAQFAAEVKSADCNSEQIVFRDKELFVGDILVTPSEDFYSIINIFISPKYRERGFSKFMFKYALDHYKSQGKEGVIVETPLPRMELKIKEILKNFQTIDHCLYNDSKDKKTMMTDWVHYNGNNGRAEAYKNEDKPDGYR